MIGINLCFLLFITWLDRIYSFGEKEMMKITPPSSSALWIDPGPDGRGGGAGRDRMGRAGG